MTLRIIGSGFGRTGTRSLKEALEHLGFGPCHHMEEILQNPEQVVLWQQIAAGQPCDWSEVFAGYSAQIDWPGAHMWRDLAQAYPEAKVIHSIRPEESWWRSFSATIGLFLKVRGRMDLPPHINQMMDVTEQFIAEDTFGSDVEDKAAALAAYRRRTQEVQASIPAERLLVFDVAEGWEPLCAFLGVPVPDVPFPHRNVTDAFWDLLGGAPEAA